MAARPRLSPAMADVRRAIRGSWETYGVVENDTVVIACSGGADSLALAAASLFEGKRAKINVIAIVVNHNLQKGSKEIADKAKTTLMELGFVTVDVVDVKVVAGSLGMEAAARNARYGAIDEFAKRCGATVSYTHLTLPTKA